ncbi:MAG TPA: hypothetical protein VL728_19420 [Cyclobacteriaceae bacterium]|nr:hypothetical protein [Cyclobacteriaceae bacterium]
MANTAVGLERVSRTVGYEIDKGNFEESSPNLPQMIAVLGEANDANQATLDLTPYTFNSLKEVANRYGYGSPLYNTMRILKPLQGDGVGGIPVVIYPQAKAGGAAAKVLSITPTGVATGNGTHKVVVSGRYGIDGVSYDVNIVTGDNAAAIMTKIISAINNVLGCPVIATQGAGLVTCTAKWSGLTSNDIQISIDNRGNSLGITYAVAQVTAGSGTPSVAAALELFGSQWVTIVLNTYGLVDSVMAALENFNGIPVPGAPTGRYTGIIMKPFIAISGSVADNDTAITDARPDNVTIAVAPAPLSAGLPFEAAANMTLLFAVKEQNTPELDVAGMAYPDMPTPSNIGTMASYDSRDQYVKKGNSTVDLVAGRYVVQDFVTTYHPQGEEPPQFSYCRNLMLDFNARFVLYFLEQIHVVDHVIANDTDVVTAAKVVKPKQWKAVLDSMIDDLVSRGWFVDPDFSKASIKVSISTTNPNRIDTFYRYKRSGVARISSTTVEAGFNFGTLN